MQVNLILAIAAFQIFFRIISYIFVALKNIFLHDGTYIYMSRSQWPRGLRRKSEAVRLLRSWI
jgi:hypothetical protein